MQIPLLIKFTTTQQTQALCKLSTELLGAVNVMCMYSALSPQVRSFWIRQVSRVPGLSSQLEEQSRKQQRDNQPSAGYPERDTARGKCGPDQICIQLIDTPPSPQNGMLFVKGHLLCKIYFYVHNHPTMKTNPPLLLF